MAARRRVRLTVRIAHVYKDSFPPVHGGIEQHVALLAFLQAHAGHQVAVVVAGASGAAEERVHDGYRLTRLPEVARVASSPLTVAFGRALRGLRAEIVHFHHPNPVAEVFAPLLDSSARIVVSYHADITRQRVLRVLYRPYLRHFLRRAGALITSSERLRDSSPVLAPFRGDCHVVPYGIPVPPRPSVRRRANTVLFVGRLREYKGLPVLLRAIARAPGVTLRIVGSGPMKGSLEADVAELGLDNRISFLGDLDATTLNREYGAATALVLPSTQRSEAFGIVLVEALHRGTPLITTELGTGTSWVNQHGATGLVVAPDDPAALSRAIVRLCGDEQFWQQTSAGARERAATFTSERMLHGVMNAYRSTL